MSAEATHHFGCRTCMLSREHAARAVAAGLRWRQLMSRICCWSSGTKPQAASVGVTHLLLEHLMQRRQDAASSSEPAGHEGEVRVQS